MKERNKMGLIAAVWIVGMVLIFSWNIVAGLLYMAFTVAWLYHKPISPLNDMPDVPDADVPKTGLLTETPPADPTVPVAELEEELPVEMKG